MIVYYRMCDIPSTNSPPIFKHDKYRLNRLCLKSFVEAYKNIKPTLYFICDFCPPQYADMIHDLVPFLHEVEFTTKGINETCLYQYGLFEQQLDDTVLFTECDYYWLKPLTESIIKQLRFVSPYDHPDKYPYEESKIQIVDNHHFKKTISTTSTFATDRPTYEVYKEILKKYGYIDHERWVEIGGVYTPIPTFATHMVTNYLSPSINWNNLWKTQTS